MSSSLAVISADQMPFRATTALRATNYISNTSVQDQGYLVYVKARSGVR